jgi:hypothetical protein
VTHDTKQSPVRKDGKQFLLQGRPQTPGKPGSRKLTDTAGVVFLGAGASNQLE